MMYVFIHTISQWSVQVYTHEFNFPFPPFIAPKTNILTKQNDQAYNRHQRVNMEKEEKGTFSNTFLYFMLHFKGLCWGAHCEKGGEKKVVNQCRKCKMIYSALSYCVCSYFLLHLILIWGFGQKFRLRKMLQLHKGDLLFLWNSR